MRIDRLEIENFKKFKKQNFDLHPQFTLLAGENGSGKTSVLDALAVGLGVWLVEKPDTMLLNSGEDSPEGDPTGASVRGGPDSISRMPTGERPGHGPNWRTGRPVLEASNP